MTITTKPIVSVVSGSYNRLPFLKQMIESVRRELANVPHEIIIVDGGSSDGTLNWLVNQRDVIVIVQHNRGEWRGNPIERRSWGYFMNLAFKCAQGKYILMISDDSLIIPNAINNGIKYFEALLVEKRKVGAMAFYYRDWPLEEDYKVTLNFGLTMVNHGLYLKNALQEVSWIDEDSYKFYFADYDLSLKLWQNGYEIIDSPTSFLEHFSDANHLIRGSNNAYMMQDQQCFEERWMQLFPDHDLTALHNKKCLNYDDSFKTFHNFPALETTKLNLRHIWRATKSYIKLNIWEPLRLTQKRENARSE